MTPKTYERVTNTSFLLAVLSALLFDRVDGLRWIIGGLGIIAGVVSAVTYFMNQSEKETSDAANKQATPDAPDAESGPEKKAELTKFASSGELNEAQLAAWNRLASKRLYDLLPRTHDVKTHVYIYRHGSAPVLNRWKEMMDSNESSAFAERVVAIVRRLCAGEEHPAWEFKIAKDGSFTIRSSKGAPSPWTERLSDLAEEETVVDAAPFQKPN